MPDRTKSGTGLTEAQGQVPTSIPLGPKTTMDLSWLPEEERTALLKEYTGGMLDISRRAQELHVEVAVLDATLEKLAGTTKQVSEQGDSITLTHTQTSSVGRTEVMMGNTDRAQSGKLTKSQTGEKDWTPYYVIGGLIATVLVAAIVVG